MDGDASALPRHGGWRVSFAAPWQLARQPSCTVDGGVANPCWALARLPSERISSSKIFMHIIYGVSKDRNGENNFLFIFFLNRA